MSVLTPSRFNATAAMLCCMSERAGDRDRKALKAFMQARGLTVRGWAMEAGISIGALKDFLSGRNQTMTHKSLEALAKAQDVSVAEILGEDTRPVHVKVYGYAGAGERVEPVDGDDLPTIDMVEGPPGMKDPAAVIVKGDSMLPMFHNGDTIFFEKRELQPEQVLGRECIVRVKDGPVLLKRLMRGSRRGRFHLVSINPAVPPIEDQPVVWVAKIRWVKRLDD